MLRGIDHVVIAGPNLEDLTATFKALGFTVVGGGSHPIGSYNTLIGLQDGAYIELLSFYEESPNHGSVYFSGYVILKG
ncbi:MAG: VOC family protein [Chloroflexi bacterium]|nr:VOC family protein [Chloroflexota bacterium]